MTLNPILRVLSAMRTFEVRCLLMGGQACVLYGASEFSRDTDLALPADPANLNVLRAALDELQAVEIAVPPLSIEYLQRGHAVHFRCAIPEAAGMRVDLLSVMRGVEEFGRLWERRTTLTVGDVTVEVMALPDLIQAKKTQRDKDWPMIRRLIEADYEQRGGNPAPTDVAFWLAEARTVQILRELAHDHPAAVAEASARRPLLAMLGQRDAAAIEAALAAEEHAEREADRQYWEPLRRELETLRRER